MPAETPGPSAAPAGCSPSGCPGRGRAPAARGAASRTGPAAAVRKRSRSELEGGRVAGTAPELPTAEELSGTMSPLRDPSAGSVKTPFQRMGT